MTKDEEVRAVCAELADRMAGLRSTVADLRALLAVAADEDEQEVPVP